MNDDQCVYPLNLSVFQSYTHVLSRWNDPWFAGTCCSNIHYSDCPQQHQTIVFITATNPWFEWSLWDENGRNGEPEVECTDSSAVEAGFSAPLQCLLNPKTVFVCSRVCHRVVVCSSFSRCYCTCPSFNNDVIAFVHGFFMPPSLIRWVRWLSDGIRWKFDYFITCSSNYMFVDRKGRGRTFISYQHANAHKHTRKWNLVEWSSQSIWQRLWRKPISHYLLGAPPPAEWMKP